MKLHKSFSLTLLLTVLVSASCSRASVKPSSSSSAGALTANSALENLTSRPFERHMLNSAGFPTMNEFIRVDVRSRIDEEPVGDSDGGYDPSTVETGTPAEESQAEVPGESQPEESQQALPVGEDSDSGAPSKSMKFGWAKKSFGDAIRANPTASGVIVVYADENYYDINNLMRFIEEGRELIAKKAVIGGERVQVVFGGYRGVPQIELWVVSDGGMPELKPDDRSKASEPEN